MKYLIQEESMYYNTFSSKDLIYGTTYTFIQGFSNQKKIFLLIFMLIH